MSAERRKFPRFDVIQDLAEPVTIEFQDQSPAAVKDGAKPLSRPAILTNLSAGGMSVIFFVEPPVVKKVDIRLGLPGLTHILLQGSVVRVFSKGAVFNVGISFSKISRKDQERINKMAADDLDCNTRRTLRLPEVCVSDCSFHALCGKPCKSPYWPKDASS